jgi:hypothetical protein
MATPSDSTPAAISVSKSIGLPFGLSGEIQALVAAPVGAKLRQRWLAPEPDVFAFWAAQLNWSYHAEAIHFGSSPNANHIDPIQHARTSVDMAMALIVRTRRFRLADSKDISLLPVFTPSKIIVIAPTMFAETVRTNRMLPSIIVGFMCLSVPDHDQQINRKIYP